MFEPSLTDVYDLPGVDSWPATHHRFQADTVDAVQAALAAKRPLLLRGEPGIGKSQLGRAVAAYLKVPFLYHVIDERTERDDLLYSYDAVSRLAQAQLASILYGKDGSDAWSDDMAEERFIRPGALWWAFNWSDAQAQADRYFRKCPCPTGGVPLDGDSAKDVADCSSVVLIDEIDKADPSVPNGLLESLGNDGFRTSQLDHAVELPTDAQPPLVMITTNEERELPAAFLRRCFVLVMKFPPKGMAIDEFLLQRARVFFNEAQINDEVCHSIARQLIEDRRDAEKLGVAKPGAAEFLDIARVLVELHSGNEADQMSRLKRVSQFALRKHAEAN